MRRMLPSQARIAVVAPSGAYDPARVEAGMAVLRGWGYRPAWVGPRPARLRYLAGDDDARLAELVAASAPEWDAVWMARGGYGLARLLPRLDLSRLRVPLFGFSDGTALLNPLADAGGRAVHAPVLHSLADLCDDASREHLRRLLAGAPPEPLVGETWVPGAVEAPVVGGNLCVLASLCGTPWQLRAEGRIVLLEEVGEAPYKVDRLLTQLRLAGALDGAAGFALGAWVDCRPPEGAGWTLREVLEEQLGGLGVPVVAELPVGHGPANRAVPFAPARLGEGALTWTRSIPS